MTRLANRRTIIVVAIAAAMLLLCSCAAIAAFVLLGDSGGQGLSDDQKQAIDRYAEPQSFSLSWVAGEADGATGSDPVRYEIWEYYDAGFALVFVDGKLKDFTELPGVSDSTRFPALRPGQFVRGMDPTEVSKIIGGAPDEAYRTAPDIELNRTYLMYAGQVLAVFDEEGLVSLETCGVETSPTPATGDGGSDG